ncbi:MAG: hypothetical protein LPJ89_03535, partial [Hymenobacteraceae bacterium]|nr:hypothetical protein [Hymenobacteraceae bacterium]MDX5395269.1 hypothetical protein [Hymenobacteraceae bacterium]MDX5442835.1 hypothetical protein [Hymenobacteraceae bacterium]MDX5511307.1 hypothetical protein [Hymenobacteraceae bacterium]
MQSITDHNSNSALINTARQVLHLAEQLTASPSHIFICTPAGLVLETNQSASEAFQFSKEPEKHINQFLTGVFEAFFEKTVQKQLSQPVVATAAQADQTNKLFTVTATPVQFNGTEFICLFARFNSHDEETVPTAVR